MYCGLKVNKNDPKKASERSTETFALYLRLVAQVKYFTDFSHSNQMKAWQLSESDQTCPTDRKNSMYS